MKAAAEYLAFDLGAASGRAILVRFDGRRFAATDVHRFDNVPVEIGDGLHWDAQRLFGEIKTGLRLSAERGVRLSAVGIDTWGVDFALLGAAGELLAPPRHYRDRRNPAAMERVLERVPRERIHESTGIQLMPINTLFQLYATAHAPQRLLDRAKHLVFMPDLFNFWLSGQSQTERTIASTSQAMSARTGEWDRELLEMVGVPPDIMPVVRPTGSLGGSLGKEIAAEVGQARIPVALTASHDTAAAVAAVPAMGDDWAYISSGTWSLVGVELASPLISAASLAANFTNEAGVAGTTRFLRNVAGLWLVQECRRCWVEAGRELSFADLTALAEQAEPLRSLFDPDDPRFASPGDMAGRIRAACRELAQPEPADEAALIRCVLDSLALRYNEVLRTAATITGRTTQTVHVVGGGSRNDLLNRLIAAATDCDVIAGPAEATALGNAAVQAIAVGDVPDLAAARQIITASVDLARYEPPTDAAERARWAEARQRFADLTGAPRAQRRS